MLLPLILVLSTHLAKDRSTFFIKVKPNFVNGRRSLPRNPQGCIILNTCVFENLIMADDLFAKALRRLATWLSVNNTLWGKLVSSSPVKFNDNLRVTSRGQRRIQDFCNIQDGALYDNKMLEAVNYYHKELHLGCCSSPGSAVAFFVADFNLFSW